MDAIQFRAYQDELRLTHAATAALLGISEVSVKRYATLSASSQPIPPTIAKLMRALVLLHRDGRLGELERMA